MPDRSTDRLAARRRAAHPGKPLHPGGVLLVLVSVFCGLWTACGSATDGGDEGLRIRTSTTGVDPDPDGYSYRVTGPGEREGRIEVEGSVEVEGLPVGEYRVELGDLAPNCSTADGPTRSVNLPWRPEASFAVSCRRRVGSLLVSVSMSGPDPDLDGFEVSLDDGASRRIRAGETTTFTGVEVGGHLVMLGGVAANCQVSGGASRAVEVPFEEQARVDFEVLCEPSLGAVEASTRTTGTDTDPDGYLLVVGERRPVRIGPNASVSIPEVPSGTQTVELMDVAPNCSVSDPNPRSLEVPTGGAAVAVDFRVTCSAVREDDDRGEGGGDGGGDDEGGDDEDDDEDEDQDKDDDDDGDDDEGDADAIHVGGLEGWSLNHGRTWEARVAVLAHDGRERPVGGVRVEGEWSRDDEETEGTGTCTTTGAGTCELWLDGLHKSEHRVRLRVIRLSHPSLPYDPDRNHAAGDDDAEVEVEKP